MKIQNICTLKTSTLTKISAFAFILMLAMTFILAFALPSFAQVGVPQPEETNGYISVAPTLIGVGQTATVNLWVFPLPTNYLYAPYYGGFTGITVTFVKPNGSEDTFMPVDATGQFDPGQTQALGAIYFYYEPDMAGDWSVTMSMPAQNITDSTGTVLYEACTSNTAYFTVQTDPVLAGLLNGYPWSPLPNDYWSYPINSNNREWSAISGDWLQGGTGTAPVYPPFLGVTSKMWQPYGSAPNTAHILWNQQLKLGGLVGGNQGSLSYVSGTASGRGEVIIAGKVFVNIPNAGQFECIDLTTGEVLYTASGSITCGIHIPGNAYSQSYLDPSVVLASSFGSIGTTYLWGTSGTTWNYYDPFTGTLRRSIVNGSLGGFGGGAMLVDCTNLAYGTTGSRLIAWDMSKVVGNNWPTGITWEVELPMSLLGTYPASFGMSTDASTIVLKTPNQYWGYSTEDGTQLWNFTLTYPATQNEEIALYGADDFIIFDSTAATFHCYSMLTGAELWESPSFADSPWATTWTVYGSLTNDYDNVYLMLPDGTMAALSLATGEEVWRSTPMPSTEYTNNVVPYVEDMVMVGGNIYLYAGYSLSYQINPTPRFAMLVCLNATTGDITYTLNGGIVPSAAANGYVLGQGNSDGILYCLGKGPTKTTVSAPQTAVPRGTAMVITGSVLDMSPAAQDYDSQVLFPNGVPAVADEDMSEFMDYLYMQNSTLLNNPPTPDGVPVNLFVVKPDGTEEWITTVVSDSDGTYAHEYVPSSEGVYKVIAKFDGSGSYWSSTSQTYFTATPAAAAGGAIETEEPTTPPLTEEPTTAPPTEEPTTEVPTTEEPTTTPPTEEPSAEAPFPTTEVAIVAAVAVAAIIGIGAYWALRRR
jgi:hypothetical protein